MQTATLEIPPQHDLDLLLIMGAHLADAQQSLSDSFAVADPAELAVLADVARLLAKAQQQLTSFPTKVRPALRILLVEDHASSASVTRLLLERHGHSVEIAETGESARKMFLLAQFDLVICDIGLPGQSGWELMQYLHENYGVEGIALSAHAYPADAEKSAAAGFAAHINKPFEIGRLLDVISTVAARCPGVALTQ